MFERKHLLGLYDIREDEIYSILDGAVEMKALLNSGVKKLNDLQGKTVTTLFYENSTRTRVSFELAAKYLGATQVNISASSSSVQKGETLIDTGRTLDKMKNDVIVIRHPMAGAPHLLSKNIKASVINGGDGMNEHPTQALLDMFTMREHFRSLKGLNVAILGDIKHSRVAKSNLFGLTKCGAKVRMYAPRTLLPKDMDKMGAKICSSKREAIEGADVIMGLRIQLERQRGGLFPSLSEYSKFYGVHEEDLKWANRDVIVMHPGPVNRGVELTSGLIDGENSKIEEQVLNGVCVRMALLKLLINARNND